MADRKRDRLKRLTTGWAGRTVQTSRVAASLGRSAVVRAARVAGQEEDHLLGAALTERMDEMKGLMMKVGQMASYLEGSLPPEAQRALRKLQHGAEPLHVDAILAVIEEAFGKPHEQLYERFQAEPLAAASIGQVHAASFGGQKVAVKVQYPEIAKTLQIDLGNLERLGLLATLGSALDRREIVKELRQRFDEECNYLQEAANTRLYATLLASDRRCVVPQIVPSRCADRVLTTTFVDGRSFYEFVANSDQAARDQAGAVVFEVAFRTIFRDAVFNGDPHPGNYLFLDDGRVAFLDFGCVRYFDKSFIDNWKRLARACLEGRRSDLEEATRGVGFYTGGKYDWDAHWEVMLYLYEPFLQPSFTYTHEYVKKSYDALMWGNPNLRRTAMPAEWVFVNRLQWGLNSVLAHLGATAGFADIYRRWVYEDTVPVPRPPPLIAERPEQ